MPGSSPEVPAPGESSPPVETPPGETPPVETPPVETPPVETPPVETPPVEPPPDGEPPAEKASTTTTLASSVNPSALGQAVTYTATVHPTGATGTVAFQDAGTPIAGCTTQTVSASTATCTVTGYAAAGSNTITATYSGNANDTSSMSATLTQLVNRASTTTTLASSVNPSAVGQAVTYTATVHPTGATGTVAFQDAGTPIAGCTTQTVSASTATCTVTGYATAGSNTITATYSGDANDSSSTSAALTQVVNRASTTTTLASSVNPSAVGQAVTYTATVHPTSAIGTVAFQDAGTPITGCTAQTVSAGTATCTVTGYATAGSNTITATYSGNTNYLTSTSAALTQTVDKASTTTTLASSVNPSALGQAVTYTASVHPTTAGGTVAFQDAGTPITGCTTQTVSSGTAACTVAGYATAGSNTIAATYSGNTNYLTSTSATLTQTVEARAPFRFFSSTGLWNEAVPANAPVDPNSAAIVGSFDSEIAAADEVKKGQPNINTTAWSVPIYTVPATQATVKVTQLVSYGEKLNVALQSAWDTVPLPPEAKPAAGTDRDLVVWQPSTDHLWEFWGLEKTQEGWKAKWGGAMESASTDPGVYGPEAWPGAQTGWGVSATSLSVAGGLITLEDLELGQINHALALAIPNTRAGEYASPAQRTDGYSNAPDSMPEGAHLRLSPNLNLASLHLPRLTLMMAEAAQRYGIYVRDSSVNVAFVAQDPTPTGTNPYTGPHGYFEGKSPQQLLEAFPWHYLEILKMELH
jgi:enoyl-[acyl-carrier-protein] reductase (NADH)